MNLKQKYQQAAKEAKIALFCTFAYLAGWCAFAYLPPNSAGPIGFPLWFELSCIYLPILFVVIAYWVIQIWYQDFDLDQHNENQQ